MLLQNFCTDDLNYPTQILKKTPVAQWVKTTRTSCVCSWKAYRMPSISCSSRRESTSDEPRFPMVCNTNEVTVSETLNEAKRRENTQTILTDYEPTFSIVSMTIFLYCSFSSFRSSTILLIISDAPTLFANSTVVSTSCQMHKINVTTLAKLSSEIRRRQWH